MHSYGTIERFVNREYVAGQAARSNWRPDASLTGTLGHAAPCATNYKVVNRIGAARPTRKTSSSGEHAGPHQKTCVNHLGSRAPEAPASTDRGCLRKRQLLSTFKGRRSGDTGGALVASWPPTSADP
jgi:hypothetical protein